MDAFYVPRHLTATGSALVDAATARGMTVVRLGSLEDAVDGLPHIWGGPLFAAQAAQWLGVCLLEPRDSWLPELPYQFRRRAIAIMGLEEARQGVGRRFVKAPREKSFEAGLYHPGELPRSSDDLVLVSDVVTFTREWRLLVLDRQVLTGSRYMTSGSTDIRPLAEDAQADEVLRFAEQLLSDQAEMLPSAVTVDVGWAVNANTGDEGWAVVEANMAWFSNIYACDAERALDVVLRAAGPSSVLLDKDRPFIR